MSLLEKLFVFNCEWKVTNFQELLALVLQPHREICDLALIELSDSLFKYEQDQQSFFVRAIEMHVLGVD